MVTIGIVATCALATAVATKIALTPSASHEPIAEKPAPKAAAPVVIPITTPQPIVVQVPAPVPPQVEIVEAPPPPPRATIPVVRSQCVTPDPESGETPVSCMWDSGFPAISADGSTIATAEGLVEDGSGDPSLTIRFVDVATGKRVKSLPVLSAGEYVAPAQDDVIATKYRAMLKKIDRRAVTAQKLLDAGAYRSLIRLGSSTLESTAPPIDGLTAEYEGDAVRVIDRTTNNVVWQRRFSVASEFPNRKLDGEHCEPIDTSNIAIAWDPQTRTAVAEVSYRHGPEFCGDSAREYVMQVQR